MSGKARDKIEARLRKEQDADLRSATAGLNAGELSELVRDGLRLMLGIRTKKAVEVVERQIVADRKPAQAQQSKPQASIRVAGKPAVFKPNGR
ncbi:hypothetical protein [Paenibacillus thermotolerans]|uniref:hypothetical protein n=1 Tax=Paenibacillus thermotolerans TaxID=3027807 RepID=UPI0023676466|nr:MULTISPECIES: hypothetical protein [unclassified Paenibacillus]